jgi:hypothetical protein
MTLPSGTSSVGRTPDKGIDRSEQTNFLSLPERYARGPLIPYEHKRARAARLDYSKAKTDASLQNNHGLSRSHRKARNCRRHRKLSG